ncbi:MAG: PspC domain-containing protein [Bacteroidales bacterium]|nr:PspC domain-containing protein [Bacteroidales bacterium]
MKKTVNINVSGIIFHIDEDAYIKLNAYLESLKKHFHSVEGSNDIIDDIEARIAELLQEKLGQTKQVITIQDVNEVIVVMGQPSQFVEDPTEEAAPDKYAMGGGKRFYRDPDNKIIAGVCGGIGAYLHWDPVIIRILFIISLFAGGFGAILYLILWIVIPEASTTTEKLEMRGEKVNISNIEKTIQEEVNSLKDQLRNLTQSTKQNLRGGGSSPSIAEKIVKGLVAVLGVFGRILLIIIGIVLVLIGISFLIAFLAVIFGWGGPLLVDSDVLIMSFPSYLNLILGCSFNPFFIQAALLILLGIPISLILYSGIKLIFRFEGIRYFGITLFNIWLIGLVIGVFYSFKIYNLVKADATDQQRIEISQPVSDTIHLSYSDWGPLDDLSLDAYEVFDNITLYTDQEQNFYLMPSIRVETSKGDQVEVIRRSFARGKSVSEAKTRLSMIQYNLLQKGDSIFLDHVGTFPQDDCWRGQKIMVTVKVPEGMYVALSKGEWRIENDYSYYSRILDNTKLYRMSGSGLEEAR